MGAHTQPAPPRPAPAYGRSRGYVLRFVVAPILLVLVGIGMMLAPVVSTQYQNIQQAQTARDYSEQMGQHNTAELQAQWESAGRWNASISTPATGDPWLDPQPDADPHYLSYLQELNITPVMARIRVPSVQIDLPVYHGTSEQTLSHGVGHLYGSALPVGGPDTHAVLTGHTGITTATLFDNLIDVVDGDLLLVDVLGDTLAYRVDQIRVVLPHEVGALHVRADADLLTLITCTPYGVNTHRLLVTGERVELDAVDEPVAGMPWQPWMLWAVALSALTLLLTLTVWLIRRWRDNR